MARWGMVIDLDRCTGCRACFVACKVENNIPLSDPKAAQENRVISWLEIVPLTLEDSHEGKIRFLPRPCMMCENAPCIKVCPVRATYKGEGGLIGQIYSRCIGCRYCMNNCPYTVKKFNWRTPVWPDEMEKGFNPDVSLRYRGIVEKCTFCHHRLQRAKEKAEAEARALREDEYQPACVKACPAKAMYFGDLENPDHRVFHLSRDPRAFRLLEEMGTEPKVFYLAEEASR